jgi:outer membrane immunogenic protein
MSSVVRRQRLLAGVAGAAIVISLGLNTPARAQSAPMWTGFYIGGNAGGAWGHSNVTTAVDCSTPPGTGYFCDSAGTGAANAAAVSASGTGTIKSSGFTGGIEGGYNYQWGNSVFGIETDFESFNLGGTRQGSGTIPVVGPGGALLAGTRYTVTNTVDTDWLFTLRGRVGWLVQPNLLAYVTGGWALTKLTVSFTYSDNNLGGPANGSGSASSNKNGWTIGGGFEWALNDHWSVKAEYLYLDFGSVTASGQVPGGGAKATAISTMSTTGDLTAHIARAGVNYQF